MFFKVFAPDNVMLSEKVAESIFVPDKSAVSEKVAVVIIVSETIAEAENSPVVIVVVPPPFTTDARFPSKRLIVISCVVSLFSKVAFAPLSMIVPPPL